MVVTDTTEVSTASRKLTTSKAMVEGIAQEMERDPSVFVLGEDVGAYGGIFGSTTGLLEKFGCIGYYHFQSAPLSEYVLQGG